MYCKCYFCEDSRFSLNTETGLPGKESVIYEDNNVYITPDIAPLVCGHFLIVTKEHLNSFGNANEETFESLLRAKDFVKTQLLCDTEALFFEHGAVIEHSAGSCIDHAHMHCIPIIPGVSVDVYIKKCGFVDSDKLSATKHVLQECVKNNQPYIYYDSVSEGEWIYHVNYLPTQFFRIMISQKLSIQHNWKINFRHNDSKELFNKTLELAKKNKGENKRLYDIGEKNIVQEVIYKRFPYLREAHDDAVEFDARTHSRVLLSTDPCPEPVVCTFDAANQYYHYGRMSVLINYSDLAASGAKPHGIMLSTVMENDMTVADFDRFLEGVEDAFSEWGGRLLGGNVKEGNSFSVTGTSVGFVDGNDHVLRRKGTRDNDAVCVVGDPGMFWAAILNLKEKNVSFEQLDEYTKSYLIKPYPKLLEGEILSRNEAVTACMDSSDGIIDCLYELAEMNNKTIRLQDELLVPNSLLKDLCEELGIDYRNPMLSWGGWELVFTCQKEAIDELRCEFEKAKLAFSVIGEVLEKSVYPVTLLKSGASYVVNNFSNKRFDLYSSISFGLDKWIERLKEIHIKPAEE
jgi:thiamine-monophosphate kinase